MKNFARNGGYTKFQILRKEETVRVQSILTNQQNLSASLSGYLISANLTGNQIGYYSVSGLTGSSELVFGGSGTVSGSRFFVSNTTPAYNNELITKAFGTSAYSSTAHTHTAYSLTSHTHSKSSITDFVEGDYVHVSGNETVSGVKTFVSSPVVPTPSTTGQAANKAYVDSLTSAGGGTSLGGAVSGVAVFNSATGITGYSGFTFNVSTGAFKAGLSNTASGTYSTAVGASGQAIGIGSFVAGLSNTATGNYATAVGSYNSATALNSFAAGLSNQANGKYSAAVGYRSKTSREGQIAQANGIFSVNGDAQASSLVARGQSTDNTWNPITLDGTNAGYTVVMDFFTTYTMEVLVVARNSSTASSEHAGWQFVAVAKKDGTNVSSYVGGVTKYAIFKSGSLMADCNIVANSTYGSFDIEVSGDIGKTISWVAFIRMVEVK